MAFVGFPVVTIEEHYWDPELDEYMFGPPSAQPPHVWKGLLDLHEDRLRAMDAGGIEMQVVSLTAPSLQNIPATVAADLARRANDRLAESVAQHSDRLKAFAALPTSDPDAATLELERCIRDLGFVGAMVAGTTQGRFLSEPEFHPILACAERLGKPIYLHPSWPDEEVSRRWFGNDGIHSPLTLRAALGFTLETATQALRMIVSGTCDKFPNLNLILGHMGEALPFLLWRLDLVYRNEHPGRRSLREVLTSQFHFTTSGFFSTPALECMIAEVGIDRIMFSVDYPYASLPAARAWLETVPLEGKDLEKFCGLNAKRLLDLALDG